jgi:transcriptional regulator with XRE-family HTH domain
VTNGFVALSRATDLRLPPGRQTMPRSGTAITGAPGRDSIPNSSGADYRPGSLGSIRYKLYYVYLMSALPPSELLRVARHAAGLTQADLARALGTTQAAVARLERTGANPTVKTLDRALQATGHRLELGASPRKSSVDETLIARQLRLTPAERLRGFQAARRKLAPLVGAAERASGRRG